MAHCHRFVHVIWLTFGSCNVPHDEALTIPRTPYVTSDVLSTWQRNWNMNRTQQQKTYQGEENIHKQKLWVVHLKCPNCTIVKKCTDNLAKRTSFKEMVLNNPNKNVLSHGIRAGGYLQLCLTSRELCGKSPGSERPAKRCRKNSTTVKITQCHPGITWPHANFVEAYYSRYGLGWKNRNRLSKIGMSGNDIDYYVDCNVTTRNWQVLLLFS